MKVETLKKGRFEFRKAWTFPKPIAEFIAEKLVGFDRPILHVPCGASQLGDILMDRYYQAEGVIRGDMFHLPYEDASMPSILSDPPWEMQYHLRGKLVREFARVLRPGGKLLLNAYWLPINPQLELKELWVSVPRGGFPRNPSMFCIAEKA